ncbi:hypothetical protein BSKO_06825 [Bryopsis sp. KO-2023]|nr:hypothetical protein BSKO_06825 [Bryopsis sp. KO-2023]
MSAASDARNNAFQFSRTPPRDIPRMSTLDESGGGGALSSQNVNGTSFDEPVFGSEAGPSEHHSNDPENVSGSMSERGTSMNPTPRSPPAGLETESPFSRGPPSCASSSEFRRGLNAFSFSDGRNPSMSDSDFHDDTRRPKQDGASLGSMSESESFGPIDEIQWNISKASGDLAFFLKAHEDDGGALKKSEAIEARKTLETVLLEAKEMLRSKKLKRRASSSLRSQFKDGKAVFREAMLRLSLYETSLGTQRAVYEAVVASDDPGRLGARRRLTKCMSQLFTLIARAPRRFMAARQDHMHARSALKKLDTAWLEDLRERKASRPHWVPDSSAARCAACKSNFSLLRLRHHCRACGMVFCENCSGWTLPLPALAYFVDQRVCEMCYREHVGFALARNDGSVDTDWSQVAAEIVKSLPKAKSIIMSK